MQKAIQWSSPISFLSVKGISDLHPVPSAGPGSVWSSVSYRNCLSPPSAGAPPLSDGLSSQIPCISLDHVTPLPNRRELEEWRASDVLGNMVPSVGVSGQAKRLPLVTYQDL